MSLAQVEATQDETTHLKEKSFHPRSKFISALL